jgi:hypothetical protein
MKKLHFLFVLVPFFFISAQTYDVPEILYYKFDTGTTTTPNYASPGGGTNPASLLNLTMAPGGQFDNALLGNGGSSSTNYLNSGWNMDLGTSSWTISLWISNYPASGFGYIFGNDITTSFRCFSAGASGAGNITLRGNGINNINVTGVLPGPSVVHFVYDSAASEVRTYVNGVFQSAVAQTPFNFTAAVPFKVGGYGTAGGMAAGALLDEFRFYRRALSQAEIEATWNQSLPFSIPVELSSFTANVVGAGVSLNWTTASETNNSGFEIERLQNKNSDLQNWETVGFVAGFGTTTESKSYSFKDEKVSAGIYSYRLKQIDFDGTFEYSNEVEVEVITPSVYSLEQNYPNPFNPQTEINFNLADEGFVNLEVHNLLGQKVATLISDNMKPGFHTINFDASDLSSGIYVYILKVNNFVSSKKMMLMK